MEINQFRNVDLVINKANDNFIQKQFVSQGDLKGRTLTVQITDRGIIGEVPGLTLNLRWTNIASGLTDLSAFECIDQANSLFRIEYPVNMLTPGKVVANIQVIQNGKVTHLKTFELTVQKLAGEMVGVTGQAEYGALVTTLAKANEFEMEIAKKADKTQVDVLGSEIYVARGGTQTLRERLDSDKAEVTAQLAQKVEIGKVTKHDLDVSQDSRKLDLENFSDAVLSHMAGNTPVNSTPARYSTTSEKIAKGAVGSTSISKQLNEMLYIDQISNFETGSLASANGTKTDTLSRIRSDGFINIQKGVVSFYDFENNAKYLVFYYDTESEAFIKKTEWIKDAFLEIDQPYKIKLVLAYDDDRDVVVSFDDLVSKVKIKTSDVAMLLREQRKNTIENITWQMGTASSTNGQTGISTNRIRTNERTLFKKGTILILNDNKKFKIAVVEYSKKGNSPNDFVFGTGFLEGDYTFPKDMIAHVVMANRDDSVIESVENMSRNISFLPVSQSDIHKVVEYKNKVFDDKLEEIKNNIATDVLGSKGEFKFKFDVDATGSYISSHCMVGDELWVFPISDDANLNYSAVQRHAIDFSNNTQSLAGTFEHNWGHVNSVSYSRFTDSLILGNGSGSYSLYGKILIFENASTFKTRDRVDVSEATIIDVPAFGVKANVIWGDANNEKGNICYVITNDNKNIRKLLLGQGSNQLASGTFISGKTGLQYNGTYKILAEYSQADGDDVCQGSCFVGGKLYIGFGHDILWYTENTLHDDGTITKATVRETFYKDDGSIDPKTMQGITVTDTHIIIGLQYSTTNEIFVYLK